MVCFILLFDKIYVHHYILFLFPGELQGHRQLVPSSRRRASEQQRAVWQRFTTQTAGCTFLKPVSELTFSCVCAGVRSFVVKHRVFLIRNLELVRDRQIQMRMEREMDEEEEGAGEEREDGTSGDDSHFKSGP